VPDGRFEERLDGRRDGRLDGQLDGQLTGRLDGGSRASRGVSPLIDVIAFDGDDTLWHSESVFAVTQDEYRRLLAPYASQTDVDARLLATERANLELFGYGVKAFTLSMIETAIELSDRQVSAADIQRILDVGKAMLAHPVQLFEGVETVLDVLGRRYRLMVISKGDLFHQESKLARSGLAERFWKVNIVAEKDPTVYRRLLDDHHVDVSRFVMIGNSVRSDILPVVALGGRAVHIPYEITWPLDAGDPVEGHDRVWHLDRIADLPGLMARIDPVS
jgi:putative hydrolase of the HAD superfamily